VVSSSFIDKEKVFICDFGLLSLFQKCATQLILALEEAEKAGIYISLYFKKLS
jgi:hypothetical protein